MKLKTTIRFIFQTVIILVLGYFFNLNKNAQFNFDWNGFNIWLIVSWVCQLPLCIRKQLYPAYRSLATQGLKQYGEDVKQFGAKQVTKNDWSITNPRAIQADQTVFYSKLHDDQYGAVLKIALAVVYGLLGPVVLLGLVGFDFVYHSSRRRMNKRG